MKLLIGISGLAGVGKDTAADILVSKFCLTKISFADPIKRAAMDWWDFTEDQLWGPSELRNEPDKRYPLENGYLIPRYPLQNIGTECARAIDNKVWIRYGLRIANRIIEDSKVHYSRTKGLIGGKLDNPTTGVVFSDVRFSNEINAIKEAGGIIIRIKRNSTTLSGQYAAHASETEQLTVPDESFNYIFENYRTLEEFREQVKLFAYNDLKLEDIKNDVNQLELLL